MEFEKNDTPTDAEFKRRLHELLEQNIYSSRSAVKEFASRGSNTCKKLLANWPKGQRRKRVSDFWKGGM